MKIKKTNNLTFLIDIKSKLSRSITSKKAKELLTQIAQLVDSKIIRMIFYEYPPHGITAIGIIGRSHIAVHTWPEYEYISIDISICSKDNITGAISKIISLFDPHEYDFKIINRKLFYPT